MEWRFYKRLFVKQVMEQSARSECVQKYLHAGYIAISERQALTRQRLTLMSRRSCHDAHVMTVMTVVCLTRIFSCTDFIYLFISIYKVAI